MKVPVTAEAKCVANILPKTAPVTLPEEFLGLNTGYAVNSLSLERETRKQAECDLWKEARYCRLTSSNFGKVLLRKAAPTTAFLKTLFQKKNTYAISMEYGKRHEKDAKAKYLSKYPGRHIHECGLVVNNKFSFLGASPDGKVCDTDNGASGIIEVKCPYRCRNLTIKQACDTIKQFMLHVDQSESKISLKREHLYYYQVQGQLMVTGAEFCDFVVYTQCDLHVERIYPNVKLMENMIEKLAIFFMQYAKPYLNEL